MAPIAKLQALHKAHSCTVLATLYNVQSRYINSVVFSIRDCKFFTYVHLGVAKLMWPTLVECISLVLLFAHTNGRLRLRKNLEQCILRSKPKWKSICACRIYRYIFISCFVSGWACEVCRALYNSSFQLWGPVQPTSSVLKSHTSCFITVLFPKPLFVLLQQNKQALNVLYNIAWFTDPLMRDGEEQTQGLIIYSIATSPVVARRPSRTWSWRSSSLILGRCGLVPIL